MITRIKEYIFHCVCDHCRHAWKAFEEPERCAKCGRRSWNGSDKRRKVSLDEFLKRVDELLDSGMSQTKAAKVLGVTQGTISRWVATTRKKVEAKP